MGAVVWEAEGKLRGKYKVERQLSEESQTYIHRYVYKHIHTYKQVFWELGTWRFCLCGHITLTHGCCGFCGAQNLVDTQNWGSQGEHPVSSCCWVAEMNREKAWQTLCWYWLVLDFSWCFCEGILSSTSRWSILAWPLLCPFKSAFLLDCGLVSSTCCINIG